MGKRITIMQDDDLHKKLRVSQSKQITKTTKSVRFFGTLNGVLRKSLK